MPKEQRVSRKREGSVISNAQENEENEATQFPQGEKGDQLQ